MERRVTTLEVGMGHLSSSVADGRVNHSKLEARVDAIDKRLILLCAMAGGGGAGVVQLLLQILGVK